MITRELYWRGDEDSGLRPFVSIKVTWNEDGHEPNLAALEGLDMALVNPFRKMIAKGIDAGADGARRATKISKRGDRPVNYDYTYEISGLAQVTKEEGTDLSISLKPIVPQGTADASAGIERSGAANGTFNYKMTVSFSLPGIAGEDTDEPDDA